MKWLPEAHDALLRKFHARGQTDPLIRDSLAQLGQHFCVTTIQKQRVRLKLEPNVNPMHQRPLERSAPLVEKPNPLYLAQVILGRRLVEKPSGFWLDGLPASLTQVMQAANRARASVGMPQVAPNEAWRVDDPRKPIP